MPKLSFSDQLENYFNLVGHVGFGRSDWICYFRISFVFQVVIDYLGFVW